MMAKNNMTLEELEGDLWPEPHFDSHLVTTCHQLRKKQLEDFHVEDLRIMLGQSFGAKHLLPKAVEILRKNPFAEGDFFEGDLLVAIARHPQNIDLLNAKEVIHLLEACLAVTEAIDPKLRKSDLNMIENLVGELESKVHR